MVQRKLEKMQQLDKDRLAASTLHKSFLAVKEEDVSSPRARARRKPPDWAEHVWGALETALLHFFDNATEGCDIHVAEQIKGVVAQAVLQTKVLLPDSAPVPHVAGDLASAAEDEVPLAASMDEDGFLSERPRYPSEWNDWQPGSPSGAAVAPDGPPEISVFGGKDSAAVTEPTGSPVPLSPESSCPRKSCKSDEVTSPSRAGAIVPGSLDDGDNADLRPSGLSQHLG